MTVAEDDDQQQQLDTIANQRTGSPQTETKGPNEPESKSQSTAVNGDTIENGVSSGGVSDDLQTKLQQATDALQEMDEAL